MTAVPDHPSYDDPASQTGALLKYDRVTGARSEIILGRGRLPGEPVFVPADGAAAGAAGEDAGYLMTYVYDAATDASEFVVFDAATMDDSPVATVELPRIPFGFHGSWIPAAVVA
jgi:carotenoid cleavage dioxygenase-like enzyme